MEIELCCIRMNCAECLFGTTETNSIEMNWAEYDLGIYSLALSLPLRVWVCACDTQHL